MSIQQFLATPEYQVTGTWDACRFFFSEDASNFKGRKFASLFRGTTLKLSLSTPEVLEIVLAKNYENKAQVESDNTASHEFVDFIIGTAAYHKKISPSKGAQREEEEATSSYKSIVDETASMVLYKNVFYKWNSLSNEAKTFYENFMVILPMGSSIPIQSAQYASISNDLNGYRFNLKNPVISTSVVCSNTLFGECLPAIDSSLVYNIAVTDPSNKVVITDNVNEVNAFSVIYGGVYCGKGGNVNTNAYNATKFFNLKYNKNFYKKLLEEANAAVLNDEPEAIDLNSHLIFYTGPHNAVHWDSTKKEFFVVKDDLITGKKTPEVIELKDVKDGCYGSHVNAKDDAHCKKWFESITSKNPADFTAFLQSIKHSNFFNAAKTNISAMHPLMALSILRQFGFRQHLVYDNKAGTELYKVETFKHWEKTFLKDHTSSADIIEMLKNPDANYLAQYLDLISQYVNCNPVILNKHYTGASEEQFGVFNVPEDAAKYGLKAPLICKNNMSSLKNMWENQGFFRSAVTVYNHHPNLLVQWLEVTMDVELLIVCHLLEHKHLPLDYLY
jgi:hypothetical protein